MILKPRWGMSCRIFFQNPCNEKKATTTTIMIIKFFCIVFCIVDNTMTNKTLIKFDIYRERLELLFFLHKSKRSLKRCSRKIVSTLSLIFPASNAFHLKSKPPSQLTLSLSLSLSLWFCFVLLFTCILGPPFSPSDMSHC